MLNFGLFFTVASATCGQQVKAIEKFKYWQEHHFQTSVADQKTAGSCHVCSIENVSKVRYFQKYRISAQPYRKVTGIVPNVMAVYILTESLPQQHPLSSCNSPPQQFHCHSYRLSIPLVTADKTSHTADHFLEPAVKVHRLVLDPVHSPPLGSLQFFFPEDNTT